MEEWQEWRRELLVNRTSSLLSDLSIEDELRRIWSTALGRPGVSFRDDFFDLGGTSTDALRVCQLVEGRLGFELTLLDFLAVGTLEGLAFRIRSGRTAEWSSVLRIVAGDDALPAFFASALGGHVLHYVDIARRIVPGRTAYGLPAAGLRPGHRPLRRVPSIGRAYERAVVDVDGGRQCVVAGYSFGAACAQETARRLRRRGVDVPLLVLIAPPPAADRPPRDRFDDVRYWVRLVCERSASELPGQAADEVEAQVVGQLLDLSRLRGLTHSGRARYVARLLHDAGMLPTRLRSLTSASAARYLAIEAANSEAMYEYVPRTYDGPVLLCQPDEDPEPTRLAIERSWRRVTPRLTSVSIAGDHRSFLTRPEAHAAMRSAIDGALSGRGAG